MPRATLSFLIPDEQEEFQLAQDAGKLNSALYDLMNVIRNMRKYENKKSITIEKLEETFYSILKNNGVDL